MSHDSPLDFFSSSAKKKTSVSKKNEPLPIPKRKALSRNIVNAKNVKPTIEDPEVSAALNRVKQLNDELKIKIDQAAAKTGKTPQELEAYIASSSGLSAKDKEYMKQAEKEFADKLSGTTKKSSKAESSSSSKSKNKPTGDLKTKSRGMKRKWMPMG